MTEIHLGDIVLRPWRYDDTPEIIRAFADPAIRHYAGTVADSGAAAARFVETGSAAWAADSGVSWAVTRSNTGTVLGHVSVTVVDRRLNSAMVGYWLLPRGRGRGVATCAVRAGTAFAFSRLALHRIELAHAVDNVDSCRVAERAGYAYEGTLRDAMRYADGRWSTEHLHARLAGDEPAEATDATVAPADDSAGHR